MTIHFDSPKDNQELLELANMEVVDRILVSGTDEELEKLRIFHNLTPEQIDLYRYYVRQRESIIETMNLASEERERINPKATSEELSMGVYIEDIEPFVRKAVILLRKKGYPTTVSGYNDLNWQSIGLQEPVLASYKPSPKLVAELQPYQVELKIEPDYILFRCDKELSVEELEKIWDLIAQDLPDRGVLVPECNLSQADYFRQKQSQY